jgi:hypothetical protein
MIQPPPRLCSGSECRFTREVYQPAKAALEKNLGARPRPISHLVIFHGEKHHPPGCAECSRMTLLGKKIPPVIDVIEDRAFWKRVQSQVTAWLSASHEKDDRRCWVDDLVPSTMRRTNPAAEIEGVAWIMRQGSGIECAFLAVVPWRFANGARADFELASVSLDLNRKVLEVVLSGKETEPNQPVQRTASTAPVSSLESPARRG